MYGDIYDSKIYLGSGNDLIRIEGGGRSRVKGGSGKDRLYGGNGVDKFYGGKGKDIFKLSTDGKGKHLIADFADKEDKIFVLFDLTLPSSFNFSSLKNVFEKLL